MNIEKIFWILAGTICLLLLAYFGLAFIGIIFLSLFLYYSSRPIYRFIGKYISNKKLKALGSLLCFVIPLLLLVSYTVLTI